MHALDHFVAEAFGCAMDGFNQRLRPLDLIRAWRECLVARANLVRMDQAFTVESKAPTLFRFFEKSFFVIKAVEHSVKGRDPGSTRCKHNHLKGRKDRLAGRVEREPKVRSQIVGSRD